MGNPKGFLNIKRLESGYRPIEERVHDYNEVEVFLPEDERRQQAARCMDCGVPFCHWSCPVANNMPEWQDMIFQGDWKSAYDILQETSNFPEFTGRVCPALCEASCVLALENEAVTIRQNELSVIEKAFQEGYVKPNPPEKRTGKKVAVIGSGPAGLPCADTLNKNGHSVVLFEAAENVGGYLRYGIPDFKLDKDIIDRRVNILKEEGLVIRTSTEVGKDISIDEIKEEFDAICITIGAREPRDLSIEGRELKGIYFAMEYLGQQNRLIQGIEFAEDELIHAMSKHVVVIGGGDTGSDCVGTANRKAAKSITQLELLSKPPEHRTAKEPWPLWPKLHKTSSSHEEGCKRMWNVLTKKFIGENGKITKIIVARVEWSEDENGKMTMREVPDSEFEIKADLVFLAMGFVHVKQYDFLKELKVEFNERGNIKIDDNYMTTAKGVFSAGDASRGASLVVWAMHDAKTAAESINEYLK